MPKGFSESEKKLIRERLLQQGGRLFASYGLKKANVEEIARAAGISKGAFYLFWPSKEALFMDVVEETELRVRRDLLAAIDLPGPSPRARLFAVLQKAFVLFKAVPILQVFTGSDLEMLFNRIPPEMIQEHMASDARFFEEVIERCRAAGIIIKVPPLEIASLLYPLVIFMLKENELRLDNLEGNFDLLLELIAAYCLGEIESELPSGGMPGRSASVLKEGTLK